MVGCSGAQTTTIIYLRTVCLRINLRLNNIFCYCLNFAFLNTLIIKSSNHKSVSGYLWYQLVIGWKLTDLWLLDLIIKVFKKAKLDKQQKILLSLRFILRHTVLKYMIVVVCTPEQPTTWSLPIVLHIRVLLFLK